MNANKLAVAGSVVAGLLAVGGVGAVSMYQAPARSVQLVQPASVVAPVAPVVAPAVAPAPVVAAPVPAVKAPAAVAPVAAAPARVASPQAVAPAAAAKREVAAVAVKPAAKAAVVADPAPAVVDPEPVVVPDPDPVVVAGSPLTRSDGSLVVAGQYPDGSPIRYLSDGITVIAFPANCANADGSITKADWSTGLPVCAQ